MSFSGESGGGECNKWGGHNNQNSVMCEVYFGLQRQVVAVVFGIVWDIFCTDALSQGCVQHRLWRGVCIASDVWSFHVYAEGQSALDRCTVCIYW